MANSINQLIAENEFQVIVPSNDGTLTYRSLNTDSPSNNHLLESYQIAETIPIIPFVTGTCFNELENYPVIPTRETLFNYLCEVLIRFDTNPNYYQKEDYQALLRLLVGSFLHLYSTSALPSPYKITESPEVLENVILAGYTIKNIMIYNNEDFNVTMNLGYTVDGKELIEETELESKNWFTLTLNKLLSITNSSSLYFDCTETLTSNGIYVVVDSSYYFTL